MDLQRINDAIKKSKREYGKQTLLEENCKTDPFQQFALWFEEALNTPECIDPCAMVLATADENHVPDTRIVLLLGLELNKFIFYSNFRSHKGQQLANNNAAALNFYWPILSRQVRIRGRVEKLTREKVESYFASRPRDTQIGVHAWVQDEILTNREDMEHRLIQANNKFKGQEINCPEYWGGYQLQPFEYEFFQRRDWRMHDRLLYTIQDATWKISRLAP